MDTFKKLLFVIVLGRNLKIDNRHGTYFDFAETNISVKCSNDVATGLISRAITKNIQ